jgi:hypothetical protein
VTVTLTDGTAGTYTLTMNKTGPIGGHLQLVATGGNGCDVDLGSAGDGGTTGSPDAGSARGDGGGAGGRDGGSLDAGLVRYPDGGSAAAQAAGGCGCGASGLLPSVLAALAAYGATSARTRRRRWWSISE